MYVCINIQYIYMDMDVHADIFAYVLKNNYYVRILIKYTFYVCMYVCEYVSIRMKNLPGAPILLLCDAVLVVEEDHLHLPYRDQRRLVLQQHYHTYIHAYIMRR